MAEWVFERRVARGSFGDVLRVHGRGTPDAPVAIKRVESSKFREVELRLMRDEHPSLVRCVHHFVVDDVVHLVMELAVCSLHDLIYMQLRPSIPFMELAAHVMSGVAHLHERGFAHCDVKPENVLYYKQGVFRLCDFGCALRLDDAGTAIHGTDSYMPPELLEYVHTPVGARPPLTAADCWSCGMTLLEVLLRGRAFGRGGPYNSSRFAEFVASGDDIIGQFLRGERAHVWHASVIRPLLRSRVGERGTARDCVRRIEDCAGLKQLQRRCSSSDDD